MNMEGGLSIVIVLLCCHLMGVVHATHIRQEFDTINSKYGEKQAMMPNMVGILVCNGL